ncbi:unnamed protein product [Microthlaspi erraticum]|uniref:Hydrophobic seed protein domain-containing protein n=1 Tax=Microthlaspi erraticum TaxID=1685480 RepID=A0A6D2KFC3_9BRAS|nr:unnamed protein product [Microthlaspi erraticum]
MASKNMKTSMALYLTFNLVFLGFVSAQPPVVEPLMCPLSVTQLNPCVSILGLVTITLTAQNVATCCNVLAGVGLPNAPECACEAARNSLLGGLGLGLNVITGRVNELFSLCPLSQLPVGSVTCSL